MSQKTALILSGGGARGAYQVGVLKGVSEILHKSGFEKNSPFQILSGVSAGAINTAKLACSKNNFHNSIEELVALWSNLSTDKVFKADLLSLQKLFSVSQILSPQKNVLNSILDTSPLRKLLNSECDFSQIQKNLEMGLFESVIITANNYQKNKAYSFIQAKYGVEKKFWNESRRQALETELSADHILASSSIPLLFPPIRILNDDYGDGCVRNATPCSPSLRMGAHKLFVVGVRTQNTPLTEQNFSQTPNASASLIKIINTLLNAVLLDSVEQDVQRILRINELILEAEKLNPDLLLTQAEIQSHTQLRKIPALCISPSKDIGEIARQKAHHIPRMLRLFLKAFGDLDDAHELLSYLLFDGEFCKELVSMGYTDALDQSTEILNFFNE